jgi:hypothetical protein
VSAPGVCIYEVGPRDGLQNEPETVPTDAKLELVRRLAAAGLARIEVTSFVSPKWIPQLADGEALAAALTELPQVSRSEPKASEAADVRYSALVPNEQGYARFALRGRKFRAASRRRAKTIGWMAAVFISASETHNRKNVNCGSRSSSSGSAGRGARARADGVALRAYVSTVCGCPYEGAVAVSAVTELVEQLRALGVEEISLGDTIGVGVPAPCASWSPRSRTWRRSTASRCTCTTRTGARSPTSRRATRPESARSTRRWAGSAAVPTRRRVGQRRDRGRRRSVRAERRRDRHLARRVGRHEPMARARSVEAAAPRARVRAVVGRASEFA